MTVEGKPAEAERLDALAVRVARGDGAAFAELYEALARDLYCFVRNRTDDDRDAEDIVSDVFLRAWRFCSSYRAGSNAYRAWIFTIARNRVRSHWATRPRLEELTGEFAADTYDLDQPLPHEVRSRIGIALAQLNSEQREAVVRRYFRGQSHSQVAEAMGKREPAVRALLGRALRSLRRLMDAGEAPDQRAA